MTRATCEELADRIVDYVDGELPAEEARIVARHLNECPRCRQTAKDLQRSLDLVRILWQDNLGEATAVRSDTGRRRRSMGVPPMSSTAVPAVSHTGIPSANSGQALPVATPDHGRDAHATHGQDAHAATCRRGHTTESPRRRALYALAVAASILFATVLLVRPVLRQGPGDPTVAAERIEREVARAGMAAQLLAATQMLARCEGTEAIVERQYQYILREYADTPVGKTIRADWGSGGI
jgi:anti-sigma factor RsiW